jgi:hypothetical protein
MFGLGDNDDEQRFWNLVLCDLYMTDREIEDAGPFLCVVALVAIVVGIAVAIWGS